MSFSELKDSFIKYCKNNVLLCLTVIFALILALGFQATHYSYHVDMLIEEYYNGTALITAGRFSAPLINYLSNWMAFAPFWHTAMLGFLLFLSGLTMGLVFKEASENQITDKAVFAFWIVFSTFPIICYQMTYPILSIVLPYFLTAVSMWLIMPLIECKKVGIVKMISSVILLVISIDMYESFASVFLTFYFAVMLVKCLYSSDSKAKSLKGIVSASLKILLIVAAAVLIDFIVSKLLCYLAGGTFEFWYSANSTVSWKKDSVLDTIKRIVADIVGIYFISGVSNYSIFLFDIALVAGSVISAFVSFKRRSIWCFVLYLICAVSSLSLTLVLGYGPEFRMAQPLSVFVAFFILLVFNSLPKKLAVKCAAWCILGIMVMNQTLFINRYTVLDYERHEYENNILSNISDDLKKYPINNKAVIFINGNQNDFPDFESTPLDLNNPISNGYKNIMCKVYDRIIPDPVFYKISEIYGHRVKYSLLNSYGIAQFFNTDYRIMPYSSFNIRCQTQHFLPEIYRAFDKLGNHLIVAQDAATMTDKEYRAFCDKNKSMTAYPNDGYIKETDELIIVKIYD